MPVSAFSNGARAFYHLSVISALLTPALYFSIMVHFINQNQTKEERKQKRDLIKKHGFNPRMRYHARDWSWNHIIQLIKSKQPEAFVPCVCDLPRPVYIQHIGFLYLRPTVLHSDLALWLVESSGLASSDKPKTQESA